MTCSYYYLSDYNSTILLSSVSSSDPSLSSSFYPHHQDYYYPFNLSFFNAMRWQSADEHTDSISVLETLFFSFSSNVSARVSICIIITHTHIHSVSWPFCFLSPPANQLISAVQSPFGFIETIALDNVFSLRFIS